MDDVILHPVMLVMFFGVLAIARRLREHRRALYEDTAGCEALNQVPGATEESERISTRMGAEIDMTEPTAGSAPRTAEESTGEEVRMDMTRMALTQISQYLEECGNRFRVDEEKGIVRTGFRLSDVAVTVMIVVTHDGRLVQVISSTDLVVPEKWRVPMAETVVRANYGLSIGRFDLDMSDGMMAFHASGPLDESGISEEQFTMLLAAAVEMMNRYHRAFCRLIYADDMTPAEVVAEIELASKAAEDELED